MSLTVALSAHTPRVCTTLAAALASVCDQTVQPDAIVVAIDHDHQGAAVTKNRALAQVQTEFVAFLDSDDEFLSTHLEVLTKAQQASGADVVYSVPLVPESPGFRVVEPFDAAKLRHHNFITSNSLARTGLAKLAGGFQLPPGGNPSNPCEDWGLWLAMLNLGARFAYSPDVTFLWHHNGQNTSGSGDNW